MSCAFTIGAWLTLLAHEQLEKSKAEVQKALSGEADALKYELRDERLDARRRAAMAYLEKP